jgi:tight adherence protein C
MAPLLLQGLANTMVLFVLGRLVALGLREHTYLYQLENRTKTVDAWIAFILPLVRRLRLPRYRTDLGRLLSRAGSRRDWTPDHFLASQLLLAGGVWLAAFLLLHLLFGASLVFPIGLAVVAAIVPYAKLADRAATRFHACNRDLPFVIDYLSLAMSAGLDFTQALTTVVADAPASPLVDELGLALRQMRLGMGRAEALREMERRLASPALKLFVQTLTQGMELGTDVVVTLAAMSDTLQQRRFQQAEEAAGKISVKMMIPMMCFVMPAVMIVLLGPMMLTYLTTG